MQGKMKDKTLTKPWDLLSTGVSTDSFTPLGAVLMGASVFLYSFIQVDVHATPSQGASLRCMCMPKLSRGHHSRDVHAKAIQGPGWLSM